MMLYLFFDLAVTLFSRDSPCTPTGNIVSQMTAGIDGSATVVVFVTKRYMGKVNGSDATDNCQKEFGYASRRRGANLMIPVVSTMHALIDQTYHSMYYSYCLYINALCDR